MIESLVFHPVRSLRPKAPAIANVEAAVRDALETIRPTLKDIPRGARVAITCGSRGIDRIAAVIAACAAGLREFGARPFVVPAMGSHGGGTAEGQRKVLADYGVTEERVGAPVVSSLETVSLGRTPEGAEVFMDRAVWEAGRVLAVNRVKQHTDFDGEVESGLMKVLTVGLGKLDGAHSFHENSLKFGFDRMILSMGRHIFATNRVLGGVGVVENDRHQLAEIGAAAADEVESLDRRLLRRARELHPKLPFANLDLLIVDELGKNVSGAGMDTKVIGRSVHADRVPADLKHATQIRRIYVRDVTPESEGNAIGMGLADVMHERIAAKADFNAIYTNARTSLAFAAAAMPMHFPNDRSALDFLLGNLGSPAAEAVRAAWIRNTLSVVQFLATPACIAELRGSTDFEIGDGAPAEFDPSGELERRAPVLEAVV